MITFTPKLLGQIRLVDKFKPQDQPPAPKVLGQVRLAESTLGQIIRNLIPEEAVKIVTPATWGDSLVGDYVYAIEKAGSGYQIIWKVYSLYANDPNSVGRGELPQVGLEFVYDSRGIYEVGDRKIVWAHGVPTTSSRSVEFYRSSVGDGSNKTTLIIGSLALAALVGGAIYFSTRP